MKTFYFNIALLSALFFTACEQEETINPGTLSGQTAALYQISSSTQKMADYSYTPIVSATEDDLNTEKEVTYQVRLSNESSEKMTIILKYEESKIATYNEMYKASYKALPKELMTYDNSLVVDSGSVSSSTGTMKLRISEELKPGTSYLIPLSIVSIDKPTEILNTAQTLYIRLEVTKDEITSSVLIARENCFRIKQSLHIEIGNTFTMEGLIYVDKFRDATDPGDALISTFMGTEGKTLLRFGDSSVPGNHLQAAGTDIGYTFKTKQWYHIALVAEAGNCTAYVNGKKINSFSGTTYLGEFYIGKSYNDNRGIVGRLSEIRLWNVARSEKDIANSMFGVKPGSTGLFAYWKMNKVEKGNEIPDVSGNNRPLIYISQKTSAEVDIEMHEENGITLSE